MSKKLKNIAKKILKLNVLEIQKILNIFNKKYNLNIDNMNFSNNNTKINNNIINNNNNKSKKKNKKYKLIIKSSGDSKLSTIKLIKEITNLSLIESKKIVDNIPNVIKDNLSLIEVEKLKKKFDNINVDTEIK
ncbi:MAG: ribosomal protein L7/L12 [Candidatus Shikimatogenerans sp. Tcar]|uniref:Ribosomal protein L7/L12 n=1 Tax=Candidatus Shikimatogenerans sp. Tcar TaxID=3158565 RepID=A0AAU7QRX6_9FLAO